MADAMWLASPQVSAVSVSPRLQAFVQPHSQYNDGKETRGSYAGWITHHAIREATDKKNTAVLGSLASFFHQGGSLWELERRAASVLPPLTYSSKNYPLRLSVLAAMSPLGSWRLHRWSRLSESEDPLRFSKMQELTDCRFRIEGAESGHWIFKSAEQGTAYLKDSSTRRVASLIHSEAPDLMDETQSRQRYQRTLGRLETVLKGCPLPGTFDVPLVIGALLALGDPVSCAAAGRIGKEYRLDLSPGAEFERRVRKRHAQEGHFTFADPATQNAIYFGRSVHGDPALYVRTRPLDLPWNLNREDVFFEVLAGIVHEDRHHADLTTLGYGATPEENFAFEFRAHGTEFLWRAVQGDPRDLRRLTVQNPLGFGLAFRDHYEAHYGPTT